jgi:hypothetical protein
MIEILFSDEGIVIDSLFIFFISIFFNWGSVNNSDNVFFAIRSRVGMSVFTMHILFCISVANNFRF